MRRINNNKEKDINLGTEDMKFDYVIQNPPYNPGRLWERFVLKGIDLLNENGKMVVIHPEKWRHDNKNKTFKNIINNISELHICKNTAFPGVGTDTDWYVYNKKHNDNLVIYRFDGSIEILKNSQVNRLHAFRFDSLANSILNKITMEGYDNGYKYSMMSGKPIYINDITGKYRVCGGKNNNTGWCNGNFNLTNTPLDHYDLDKIVMSYVRQPRAKYFRGEEYISVSNGPFWIIDKEKYNPESIVLLLNSKMIWSMFIAMNDYLAGEKHFKSWFLSILNFENCYFTTEKEMYEHYGLTQEEIDWIKQ